MSLRARVPATVLAAAFAALALFSGFDRYSLHQPAAARLVPVPFQASAIRVEAGAALAEGRMEEARQLASEAIAADPIEPSALGVLGASALAGGDADTAASAFAAADRLGLREPLVQAYFFERGVAEGDYAEAAQRLDNLLRVHPSMTRIDYFFTVLETSAEGRRELAGRLADDPLWADSYLTAFGASDAVLRARAAFLADQAASVSLGCGRIAPMMRELSRRNFRAEVQRLAKAQCPSRALAQAIADPGFEALDEDGAFGWRKHGSGDVRITALAEGDKAVELENRAGVTRLVLSQPVALEAGEYRLFASVSGSRSDAVLASLDCGKPSRPSTASGSLGRGQLVRAQACPDLVLGIWVRPGSGAVRLDNLRLQEVGTEPAP